VRRPPEPDFSAFAEPETSTARLKRNHWRGMPATWLVAVVVTAAVALPLLIVAAIAASSEGRPTVALWYLVLVGVVTLGIPATIVAQGVRARRHDSTVVVGDSRRVAFAARNGFAFSPRSGAEGLRGLIAERIPAARRERRDTVSGVRGVPFEIGSVGGALGDSWMGGGYIEVRLPRRLPHLLLIPAGDRLSDTALEEWGMEDQLVELEGDFPSSFRLYAPVGYGVDVRYLMPPDLMAALVDEAGDLFVEIWGDRLMIGSDGDLLGAGEAEYRRLFRVLDVLVAEVLPQASRYADDRLPAVAGVATPSAAGVVGVAEAGRDLRTDGTLRTLRPLLVAVAGIAVAFAGPHLLGLLLGIR
jgi:hypothetical protein